MGVVALLAIALATAASAAHAHPSASIAPMFGVAPLQWTWEPWTLVLLTISASLYGFGVCRLWRHAGATRGVTGKQIAAFAAGWSVLVAALVSPLDAWGAQLFSAHMLQHELLMLVAPPLLVLGRPLGAWAWAFSPALRRRIGQWVRAHWWTTVWKFLTDPLIAWALHALAIWLWHVPRLFEAALHDEALHVLQHASFLVTALFFWWAVLGGDARSRKSSGFAMVYLFTTMLHTGALGALLTLAPTPWYSSYAACAGALGLDPVEDQQLGGLVMWVPGGLAYLSAALAVMVRLLAGPRFNPAMAARTDPPR